MPRRTFINDHALHALLTREERVVTHRELLDLGVPMSTITCRILPGGPWQRILPGVVLAHTGTPTRRERRHAALKCCGSGAVLTGMTALSEFGIKTADRGARVQTLVPHPRQRGSHDFVEVERTRRLPEGVRVRGLLCAPIPRAVMDACRRLENLDRVRAIVAEAIQDRRCTVDDLLTELRAAARQRTALSRAAMREIDAGIRSVAEAKAREVLARRGIRQPRWNVELWTPDGTFIATPDGYDEDVAVALQLDSIEYHLSPALYKKTQERQRSMIRHSILVLPYAPGDVIADPETFVNDLEAMRRQGALRPVPHIVVVEPATV